MKERLSSLRKTLRLTKTRTLLFAIATTVVLILSVLISVWMSDISDLIFPNTGIFRWRGIEGYWDSNLTNRTEACEWGTVWPGASRNVTIYLRSTSNIETVLNLTSGNWTYWDSSNRLVEGVPSSSNHIGITWDYNGSKIAPDEIVKVTLTLSVSRSSDFTTTLIARDVTRFGFDILIRTEECTQQPKQQSARSIVRVKRIRA